jgi:hypothetical protein
LAGQGKGFYTLAGTRQKKGPHSRGETSAGHQRFMEVGLPGFNCPADPLDFKIENKKNEPHTPLFFCLH